MTGQAESELEKAARKRLAQMVPELEATRTRAVEQAAAMARWLLASLLAVNGGAAVALLGSDRPPNASLRMALLWFVVGVVAAVATGICHYYEAEFGEGAAQELKTSLQDSLAGLDPADSTFARKKRGTWIARRGALLLFPVSLAAFVLGVWHAHFLFR